MRVHSEIVIRSGRVGRLNSKFDHYTYWNYSQIMNKYEMYTTWAAEDMMGKGVKPGFINLAFTPLWRFFRQYFLQGGFLDGRPGLIVCGLSMYYVFLKYAKLWRMHHGGKRPEPPSFREMSARNVSLKKGSGSVH